MIPCGRRIKNIKPIQNTQSLQSCIVGACNNLYFFCLYNFCCCFAVRSQKGCTQYADLNKKGRGGSPSQFYQGILVPKHIWVTKNTRVFKTGYTHTWMTKCSKGSVRVTRCYVYSPARNHPDNKQHQPPRTSLHATCEKNVYRFEKEKRFNLFVEC